MCVGCRVRAPRPVLLRVVAAEVHGVPSAVPDPGARRGGRGAWVHPVAACVELAIRRRAFGRALRRPGALDAAALLQHVAQQQHEDENLHEHRPSPPEAGPGMSPTSNR